MMNKIIFLMMRNKIRQWLTFIRNYWMILVVLVAMLVFSFAFCENALFAIKEYKLYINAGIPLVLFLVFLFRRFPVLSVNSATIHYISDRSKVILILYFKLLMFLLLGGIVSLILTVISCPQFSISYFLLSFTFFCVWLLLGWQKYNHSIATWILLGEMVIASVLYFIQVIPIAIIFNCLILTLQMRFFTTIFWETYMADMKYSYSAQAAAAKKDFTVMLVYANENAVKDRYLCPYPKSPKIHPVLAKSIIDALRTSKWHWILKSIGLVLSILVLTTNIVYPYGSYAFIITWSWTLTSIARQSIQAVLTLKAKNDSGLFIPYSVGVISSYYSIFPVVQVVFLHILLAALTPIPFIPILGTVFLYSIVIYCWHRLCLLKYRYQRLIDTVATIMIFVLSIGITFWPV